MIPIESEYATLLFINSNFGHILHRVELTAA